MSKVLGGIRRDWNGVVTLIATDGNEIDRHDYVPSAMYMGDCAICGNVAQSPFHNDPYFEVPDNIDVRRGDWIQTFTGRQFWPLDPRVDDVSIIDIAHALAHQCRYGGHTARFYSVAEHCCILAEYAPDDLKFIALMHDAAEAYLVDVPRPIKKSLAVYYDIEAGLDRVIAAKFNLSHPWHPDVMALDTRICTDERLQLMATPPIPWSGEMPALDVIIEGLLPAVAERRFLELFERLSR